MAPAKKAAAKKTAAKKSEAPQPESVSRNVITQGAPHEELERPDEDKVKADQLAAVDADRDARAKRLQIGEYTP